MTKFKPKRKQTKSSGTNLWVYEDPSEQALAIKAAILGFNLVEFDTWLTKLEECVVKDELITRRQAAVKAKTINELRARLEFLNLVWIEIKRDDFLLPFARIGKKTYDKSLRRVIQAVMKIMCKYKKEGHSLKEFLQSAANESIKELSIVDSTPKNSKNLTYEISVESESGDEVTITRKKSTLDNWWADCDS
jgi:hypothetical protein